MIIKIKIILNKDKYFKKIYLKMQNDEDYVDFDEDPVNPQQGGNVK